MPPTASEVATHWRDMREAIMDQRAHLCKNLRFE